MEAMILAAGTGSRLTGVTEHTPKALVEVGGMPMLERVAKRLIAAGTDRLIINISHHADQIEAFVEAQDGFGVDTVLSREVEPLETGGGILNAASLFTTDAPFFVHNADVICGVELGSLYASHVESGALATLAVNHRDTSRYLLFNGVSLCGRYDKQSGHGAEVHSDCDNFSQFAFAGVHVISPPLLGMITERGMFSIIDVYLRLAAEGHPIVGYDMGSCTWLDVGTPERLARARAWADSETSRV
ncbi:MAG: sugar phosphate nucleotidyltransferase [Longimicrobiales bacterium]